MLVYQRVGEGFFRCISDLFQIFRVFPCMFGSTVGHQIICHKVSSQNLGASLQKGMLKKNLGIFQIVMEGLEDLSPPGVPGPDTTMEASKQRWYKLLRNPRRRRAATPWIV